MCFFDRFLLSCSYEPTKVKSFFLVEFIKKKQRFGRICEFLQISFFFVTLMEFSFYLINKKSILFKFSFLFLVDY